MSEHNQYEKRMEKKRKRIKQYDQCFELIQRQLLYAWNEQLTVMLAKAWTSTSSNPRECNCSKSRHDCHNEEEKRTKEPSSSPSCQLAWGSI